MLYIRTSMAVVPILLFNSQQRPFKILGTGFFMGTIPFLITAKHVFPELNQGERFGILIDDGHGRLVGYYYIDDMIKSEKFDIVLCPINNLPEIVQSLPISEDKIFSRNADIATIEYSPTKFTDDGSGKIEITCDSYYNKGNITRFFQGPNESGIMTDFMETSYPCLRYSSGAPIFNANNCLVYGMVIGNLESELPPALVISERYGSDFREERKYFLPRGRGIRARHILEFVDVNGIEVIRGSG